MARLANSSIMEDSGDEIHSGAASSQRRSQHFSPSPVGSTSSDKENHESSTTPHASARGKRLSTDMPPPDHVGSSSVTTSLRANKRRRLGDRIAPTDTPDEAEVEDEEIDTKYYDPDQDPEERRAVRKELRNLARNLHDNRTEYLAPGNNGLVDTVIKANALMTNVKQTSDATIDSRLLVVTGDLSYKKTVQMTLGDNAAGIDVDDFVSKCIRFMRSGPNQDDDATPGHSTQSRRRRAAAELADEDEDDEAGEAGDAMNWQWLGRRACFVHNARPPVPGFLLGPLSVQMRTRKERTRRTALQRRNQGPEVRPEELQQEDLEKVENSNLTKLCVNIRDRLLQIQKERYNAAVAEAENETELLPEALEKHGVVDEDGGIPFFEFVVNSHSFGQTVENLFYVSFLVRDGAVKVGKDKNNLPTLSAARPLSAEEIREQRIERYQAVFSLDWPTWLDLIDVFNIKEPLIPDRTNSAGTQVTGRGWYG